MKIIKPLKLGLLFRTFEYRGRNFWSPAVLVFFDFRSRPELKPETDLWKLVPERLGEQIFDQAMPKARAEILVNGSFFAPGAKAVPAGRVRIRLGPIDKTLFVFGDRYWKRNAGLVWSLSEPEPVTRIPIDWSHAFGGPDYKPNPLGKGIAAMEIPGRGKVVPLPNIELPGQLIGSPKDRPRPAGFGPLDLMWPQRFSKCGTYDQAWFDRRFPGLPDDLDWSFFNAAPQDQQAEGFFSGGEDFLVEGMHPEHETLAAELPPIRPRCFIRREHNEAGQDPEELELRLDTVWLFPDVFKAALIYRGLAEVASDTAKDITTLLLAYENRQDKPRSPAHYRQALERRSDPNRAGLALLDETDLIAEGEVSAVIEMLNSRDDSDHQWEQMLKDKQERRMKADLDRVRQKLAAQDLDPDKFIPMPESREYDLADMDKILEELENGRRQAEKVLAEQLAAQGLSREQLLDKSRQEPAPRPVFSASEALSAFEAVGIANDALTEKMLLVEKTFQENYRRYGHLLPPVIPPDPETDADRIRILLKACREGTSLDDMDLSGLDLAGLDLSGVDLCGAFLEGANLAGADLSGADLSRCALMRADLTKAKLRNAKLVQSGLGRCKLERADLCGADLTAASLAEADLAGAVFSGAICDKADFSDAKAREADFSKASMKNIIFMGVDFRAAKLIQADLSGSLFFKALLVECNLAGSILAKATLVKVDAGKADFSRCRFDNLRAAAECKFEEARFDQAFMEGANLRGARCRGASFEKACLDGADLSEADLRQASFYRATAGKALFIEADLSGAVMTGANLFESLLHKAKLEGTDLRGANLFGVDFMKARFRNTDVRQALTAKSTLLRWMPKK